MFVSAFSQIYKYKYILYIKKHRTSTSKLYELRRNNLNNLRICSQQLCIYKKLFDLR